MKLYSQVRARIHVPQRLTPVRQHIRRTVITRAAKNHNVRFGKVNLHVKQRAKQRQAIEQLLCVAGGPRKQVDIVCIHHIRHRQVANDGAGARHTLPNQLMQQIHEQAK
jgi:hypothetical protein